MPYRKSYKKKQNGFQKRVQIYGRAGGQLYSDVRYLKTLINSEMHWHIADYGLNIDTVGTVLNFNEIPEGDGENLRTGTSILPRFLTLHMHINKAMSGTVTHDTIKILLFRYWGSAANDAPNVTPSDILLGVDVLGFLDQDITGKKGDRERRIEVLKSKLFTLDMVADTSRTYSWNISMNGMNVPKKEHIKYRGASTEDAVSGGLYILVMSSNSSGANKSSVNIRGKLGFHDN